MKRTREVLHYKHPEDRPDLSGCTYFDGEDNGEEQRRRKLQQENREFLMKQMEEKKWKQDFEKKQDQMFDQQRLHFAKLQNQAAESYMQNQRDMTKAAMQTNVQINSYKNDFENKNKKDEQQQDRQENTWATQTRQNYVDTSNMNKYYLPQ
ncbi:UNKNOWN [Stylonychia lemnae]|uniref:RIB43A-like with coiled-coils protein 2 n=1 Tax=Stylonychia lemnae TaxID=5949 RepID=A0A078A438_STYLE|nr:UNKNOWN [Stylonychia lemnae]|eukprot:CDW76902.1 UNKNOWN [Stylonychia lemnae]